jgi:hypothetical protein
MASGVIEFRFTYAGLDYVPRFLTHARELQCAFVRVPNVLGRMKHVFSSLAMQQIVWCSVNSGVGGGVQALDNAR